MSLWKSDRIRSFWQDVCTTSNLPILLNMEELIPILILNEDGCHESVTLFTFISVLLSSMVNENLALARSGNSLVSKNNFQLRRFAVWEKQLNLTDKGGEHEV